MIIRSERPEDYRTITALVETAFKTARMSDGSEQEYVRKLRQGAGYIPRLALVAEKGGRLIGHIMLTAVPLKPTSNKTSALGQGNDGGVLLLAPLSVLLEYRGAGVGAALTREALSRAREMEFSGIVLAGDPSYYGRFGFQRAESFGIRPDMEIPSQYFLALELSPGALAQKPGLIHIPPVN